MKINYSQNYTEAKRDASDRVGVFLVITTALVLLAAALGAFL